MLETSNSSIFVFVFLVNFGLHKYPLSLFIADLPGEIHCSMLGPCLCGGKIYVGGGSVS